MDLYKKQKEIEQSQIEDMKNTYKRRLLKNEEKGNLDITAEGLTLIKLGLDDVSIKIREYLSSEGLSSASRNIQKLLIFLSNDDENMLSYIVLKTVLRIKQKNKLFSITNMSRVITDIILENNAYEEIKRTDVKLFKSIERKFKKLSGINKTKLLSKELDNKLMSIEEDIKVRIGSTLIDLLIKSGVNIIELVKSNKRESNKIKITKYAYNIILDVMKRNLSGIQNNMVPMIIPPRDWTNFSNGGYLTNRLNIVKVIDNKIRSKYKVDFDKYSDKVDSLNKLQKDSFCVNHKILDVLNTILKNRMVDSKSNKFFPRFLGGLPFIQEVDENILVKGKKLKSSDLMDGEEFENINDFYSKSREIQDNLNSDEARSLNFLKTLSIANDFKDYNNLYFVYQFDTRYRKYTHQSFLTPQGKDYAKALLNKTEYVELNEVGEKWFKIHIANVFGKDKELLDDRVKWVNENEEMILNIAENAFANLEDWAYCDSPFEFLAGCFAYMDWKNGGKTNLPIQIDATCSGLQIFSGLMLDKEGAENVNVVNKYNEDGIALRSDIYKIVADEDNRMLENGEYNKTLDIKKSDETVNYDFTKIANEIKGKISRTIVKRNVMTLSYNATREGMKQQLNDVVMKINVKNEKFWTDEDWKFVRLVLDLNGKSMDKNIKGARIGQKFLNDLAVKKGDFLNFNTPLYNAPVYSTSFKYKVKRIQTTIGKLTILEKINTVNLRKQKSSFAPNYIHSIDAELLDYVINESNFDVSAIHDCFIINPNEAENVRYLFREGFIKMMEKQPLKMLEIANYETGVTVDLINDLNLNDVKKAEYILS